METINQHFGFDSPKALQDWMDVLEAAEALSEVMAQAPGFEAWFTPDFLKSLQ